jgi:hypothetical protein
MSTAHNEFGFLPDAAVIGDALFPKIDPAIEELMIRVDHGHFESYLDLAGVYGFNTVQAIKVLSDYRPLQARLLQNTGYVKPESALSNHSASNAYEPNISAALDRARTSHRTDDAASSPLHSGNSKKLWRSRRAAQSLSNTAMARQTGCSVRISGDRSNLVLHVSLANDPVLELTFSSDGRNADKHRSFRD